jgi:tetratricopeptide (TPR) repeat protein
MKARGYILLALAGLTLLVFGQVLGFGFLFDDNVYVTENPRVLRGLSVDGVAWALTTLDAAFWHPVTWLSLMADASLFGSNPAGFHLTSLLIHLASTLLLFLVLDAMTKAPWKCAAIAALFAVHPLHVESVAWVSERKDVLAAFFWIAAMGAYLRYVSRPGPRRYLLLCACYLLGLMAKSMLVTLPFALLLLDLWPLKRISLADLRWTRLARPLLEKIPLLLPIPLISAASYAAQARYGAVDTPLDYPFLIRAGNALLTYGAYLAKTVWPARLSAFYPHPGHSLSVPLVAVSSGFLLAATAAVIWQARRRPWLFTGWFWYLGTLVPVIGFVQLGRMGMADRYTYLPLLGIFVIAAWGLPELCQRWKGPSWLPAAIGAVAISAYAIVGWVQVGYWRDGVTLFTHAIAVTGDNPLAHYNLAEAAIRERGGETATVEFAMRHYEEALRLDPTYSDAHNNLGNIAAAQGRYDEAIWRFNQVLRDHPRNINAHYNLATLLAGLDKLPEAEAHLRMVLSRKPDSVPGLNNLGVVLARQGKLAEAAAMFTRILAIDPANAEAADNLRRARSLLDQQRP